ncbi:MAG: hypothetical protein E6J32_13670 [Chloroflexi bacterium]|nr:MAG: hypothetical protein E6J32_13670 [Chloroflexota bacterium]
MAESLSVQIRAGFEESSRLAPAHQSEVRSRARDLRHRLDQRRLAFRDLVEIYRRGPKEVWGPVLLEVLAPAIMDIVTRYRSVAPVISEEDLRNQLLAEVLHVAARTRLPVEGRYVKQLLLLRVVQRLEFWIFLEASRRGDLVSLAEGDRIRWS